MQNRFTVELHAGVNRLLLFVAAPKCVCLSPGHWDISKPPELRMKETVKAVCTILLDTDTICFFDARIVTFMGLQIPFSAAWLTTLSSALHHP